MYSWFNKHLKLGLQDPFLEEDFEPLFPSDVSVWDEDEHKAPKGGDEYELGLTGYLTEQSDKAIAALTPTDEESLQEYKRVIGGALETLIGRGMPKSSDTKWIKTQEEEKDGYLHFEGSVRLETEGEELPLISLFPTETDWNGDAAIWLDEEGKTSLFGLDGELVEAARALLTQGAAILAADLFQQGDFLDGTTGHKQRIVENGREAAAYTFAYNHTLFAHRVHDVMTLIAHAHGFEPETPERVHILANGKTAPIAAAARALSGDMVDRCALITNGFRFNEIRSYRDPGFLPGAVKYGDLPALLALNSPQALRVADESAETCAVSISAYRAVKEGDAILFSKESEPKDVAEWLTKE